MFPDSSRNLSRVFRSLVLVLALVLVACGSDTDESTPTATSDTGQVAQPTVPTGESTPETNLSEEEITVLQPESASTPDIATPDTEELDTVDSSPDASPTDLVSPDEDDGDNTDADMSATAVEDQSADTPSTPVGDGDAEVEDVAAEPTVRVRTGNETFDHPGDGTGGSGMPGEGDTVDDQTPEVAATPVASPVASPVAQLSISGCEVPDVPGFLGDNSDFVLTADVNFRSGPGVECDPLLDDPLDEGLTVVVVGGPVVQTDDDTEWVQIVIDGEPGWITTEFIESAD